MLYVYAMSWPQDRKAVIKSLAAKSPNYPGEIGRIEMLGAKDPLEFTRDEDGTTIMLPEKAPSDIVTVFKILPKA